MFYPLMLSLVAGVSSCVDSAESDLVIPNLRVTFTDLGLNGRVVNELVLNEDSILFAATDAGIYARDLKHSNHWELKGANGEPVKAIELLESNMMVASMADRNNNVFKLYRSTDQGKSWSVMANNFGGEYSQAIEDFYYNSSEDKLYAAGIQNVAVSEDFGASWTPVLNTWDSWGTGVDFVDLNPLNGDIWASGQNPIEQFMLWKYDASKDQWSDWNGLLRSPSVGKDIAFHPKDPSRLLIGGEHGILETMNDGTTWKKIYEDAEDKTRFYFGVDYDHKIEERLYAVSWKKEFVNPQPLEIMVSHNGGTNWIHYVHAKDNIMGGVFDMLQVKDQNNTYLFLGLFKGGVYLATIKEMSN